MDVQTKSDSKTQREPFHVPLWLGFCAFLAIALFFLLEEHRAHMFGAIPYVLLLLCPILHLVMHREHAGHGGGGGSP